MKICVFGAASPLIDNVYKEKTETLGKILALKGHSLVFGGGGNGLMGAVASGFKQGGGKIVGVVPKFFLEEGVEKICDYCDKLITPDTMRERKQIMDDESDAFITVPGGIGTWEEFFEVLTSRQLCRHNKPIAVYNINGFYDNIYSAIENGIDTKFINENCRELLFVSDDIEKIIEYIETPSLETRSVKELKDG